MSNFSLLQIIIVILLLTLIFGDLPKIVNTAKKKLKNFIKINTKNRKKGS